jgi:hypothetical protein
MLTLPSLQREYPLVFSGDTALDLPSIPDVDDLSQLTEEQRKAIEERENKLRVARETGRWYEILKGGQHATVFWFRSIHDDTLTWLGGETMRRRLSEVEAATLAFRLALVRVENFGAFKLQHETRDGHRMVKEESLRPLYNLGLDLDPPLPLGRALVLELGALVLIRAKEGVPPKS